MRKPTRKRFGRVAALALALCLLAGLAPAVALATDANTTYYPMDITTKMGTAVNAASAELSIDYGGTKITADTRNPIKASSAADAGEGGEATGEIYNYVIQFPANQASTPLFGGSSATVSDVNPATGAIYDIITPIVNSLWDQCSSGTQTKIDFLLPAMSQKDPVGNCLSGSGSPLTPVGNCGDDSPQGNCVSGSVSSKLNFIYSTSEGSGNPAFTFGPTNASSDSQSSQDAIAKFISCLGFGNGEVTFNTVANKHYFAFRAFSSSANGAENNVNDYYSFTFEQVSNPKPPSGPSNPTPNPNPNPNPEPEPEPDVPEIPGLPEAPADPTPEAVGDFVTGEVTTDAIDSATEDVATVAPAVVDSETGDAKWTVTVTDDDAPATTLSYGVLGNIVTSLKSAVANATNAKATSVQDPSLELDLKTATQEEIAAFSRDCIEAALNPPTVQALTDSDTGATAGELVGKEASIVVEVDGDSFTYTIAFVGTSDEPETVETVAVYRYYNKWDHLHIYTSDETEIAELEELGWTEDYGKPMWYAPTSPVEGGQTILRFNNPYSGDHYYCPESDAVQIATLKANGWEQDSSASNIYSGPVDSTYAVSTLFNPYGTVDTHLYTTDPNEIATLVRPDGWESQTVVIYGMAPSAQ